MMKKDVYMVMPKNESTTRRITPITPPKAQTITFAIVMSPSAGKILKNDSIRRIITPAAAFISSLIPFFRMKKSTIQAITASTIKTIVATISAI